MTFFMIDYGVPFPLQGIKDVLFYNDHAKGYFVWDCGAFSIEERK